MRESSRMLSEMTQKLLDRQDLTQAEAEAALSQIVREDTSDATISSFLTALALKGECASEVAGFAGGLRKLAEEVSCQREPLLDTAGTGGGLDTFNVSTTAAFVIAGAGVVVAKHGNRAVTSQSGSADLLEELGVDIQQAARQATRCLEEIGIGFLFAPCFHPAMKRVAGVRRKLAHRTIFNMAGPLANPARASYHLIGVWEAKLTQVLADAFCLLDGKRAWIVHSQDGMDELSVLTPTWVAESVGSSTRSFQVDPGDYRFASLEGNLSGGSARENGAISRGILGGEIQDIRRSVVLLNAAAGLAICLGVSLEEGLERAGESLASGAALQRLQELIRVTKDA